MFFDNTNITVEKKYDINWGQRKFHYPAPSGFSVVNKYNLPSPAIPVPKNYMGTTAFVGTGSSLTISDFDFDPGLVMLCKVEDGTYSNFTHIFMTRIQVLLRLLWLTLMRLNQQNLVV